MTDAITATGLAKRFGSVQALAGLDRAVPEGTVLGLLGPNGAGKTTTVSILATLPEPDEGDALVAGVSVRTDPGEVRRRIGLSGQFAAVDEVLADARGALAGLCEVEVEIDRATSTLSAPVANGSVTLRRALDAYAADARIQATAS